MKKSMKSILALACAALFTMGLASCQQQKSSDEKIRDGFEQVGEGIEQGAQEFGNEVEQGAQQLGNEIEQGAKDLENEIKK